MIDTQQAPGTAWMDARGERMRVKLRSIEDVPLLNGLPDSRRIPPGSVFSATPTPFGCWELGVRGYRLEGPLAEMAGRWDEGQQARDFSHLVQSQLPPMGHQVSGFNFGFAKPATLLGMDVGTGKTMTAIMLIEAWWRREIINHPVFVVCPNVVASHWPSQWVEHGTLEGVTAVALSGSGAAKAKQVQEYYRAWELEQRRGVRSLLVLADNFEAVWRKNRTADLLDKRWGCVILDESHRAKGHSTIVSKFAYQLGQRAEKRAGLTATAIAENPGDAFGQLRFLDAAIFGTSWTRFKAEYAIAHPHIEGAVIGWRNQEQFAERLGKVLFSVNAREVMDLPPETDVFLKAELCPKLRKVYDELAQEMCSEWDGREITIDNALVKMLRLQQFTAGYIVDDNGEAVIVSDAKIKAWADWMTDLPESEKVVVCTRFKDERELVRKACEKLKRPYYEVSGEIKEHAGFIADKRGAVLCMQIRSGGTGLDGLQRVCRYATILSTGTSRGDYLQFRGRLVRKGQERPVTFVHFHVPRSIDEYLVEAFRRKGEVVDFVMEQIKAL